MTREKRLNDIYKYALSLYGKPYCWGGQGAQTKHLFSGAEVYDCSGFVQTVLGRFGLDPKGDQTAAGLYTYYLFHGTRDKGGLGSLAFFGNQYEIRHVGWCIDEHIMINAAGGGSKTCNVIAAKKQHAFVKIEPIKWHSNFYAFVMPDYD